MRLKNKIDDIRKKTKSFTILETIWYLRELFPNRVALSSAFDLEGQVITDFIFSNDLPVDIFTLDTGRMFEETYDVHYRTEIKYKKKIKIYYPESIDVEELVNRKGTLSFYESIDNRKECCYIRKIKPLHRALQNVDVWITGLRSSQSENRAGFDTWQWDEKFQCIKYNPLIDWSLEEVKNYIEENKVPYNRLFDQNFTSIGCAPCTRAVNEGEDIRAGRWWWELSKKECGLHHN